MLRLIWHLSLAEVTPGAEHQVYKFMSALQSARRGQDHRSTLCKFTGDWRLHRLTVRNRMAKMFASVLQRILTEGDSTWATKVVSEEHVLVGSEQRELR